MTLYQYRSIQQGPFHGLVHPEHSSDFSFSWFEPTAWGHSAAPISGSGRGSAWFLTNTSGPEWVLRHYRRGGLPGKLFKDVYLFLGEGAVRSFREFILLLKLHQQGLPVPRPVAASYHRAGLLYRAHIIVEKLPHTRALLALNSAAHQPLWEAAGRCIRQFHDAGVYHADLNATNILVNPDSGQVYLIDFDRGEQRPNASANASWKRANLERLERGIHKHWAAPGTAIEPFMNALKQGYR